MDLHLILIYYSLITVCFMCTNSLVAPLDTVFCFFDPGGVLEPLHCTWYYGVTEYERFSGNSYWMTDHKLWSQISFGTLNDCVLQPFRKFSNNTCTFYSGWFTLSKSQIVLGKPLKVYTDFDVCVKIEVGL